MPDGYDFSFSGIKTGVVNYVSKQKAESSRPTADIAASFQAAVVDVLVEKAVRAAKDHGCRMIALAGGVSANSQLREELNKRCAAEGLTAHIPSFEYCTDNAAMIAAVAFHKITNYQLPITSFDLTAVASLKL
jgi:N6-L-threonylcarbamoyladenine synthase